MKPVAAPRLLPAPAPLADPELVDGTEWAGVDVTGEVEGEGDLRADFVEMSRARLTGLRLTGWRIDHLRMVDVLIEDCELSAVTLPAAHLTRVEFRRCRLSGLSAPNLKARHVRFTDCRADGTSFRMSSWDVAELSSVDLRDADFHASTLAGVRLLGCDLTGADVSKASMAGAALHGSTVEGLKGADCLRGVVIGSEQVVSLTVPLLVAMGIVVDDDYLSGAVKDHPT
ncbi:MAG TPA: pentapeptide repeat-containing protein [Acidimicrobiales bacterium]|nr:pentapeptide repeat-containing protein [Acidimicrobiales bacterium]